MTEIKSLHPRLIRGNLYMLKWHTWRFSVIRSCHKACQPRVKKMFFVSFLQSNTKRRALLHPIPDDVNSLITLLKKERNVLPFFLKELGNILPQDEERIVQIYS